MRALVTLGNSSRLNRMRYLSKFSFLDSLSGKSSSFLRPLKFHNCSIHYESPLHHPHKEIPLSEDAHLKNTQSNARYIASLFHQITEIIGTESISSEKSTPETSVSEGTHVGNKKLKDQHASRLRVCRNGTQSVQLKTIHLSEETTPETSISEETQLGNAHVEDLSPIVHKITAIIRAKNAAITMEGLLEDSDFPLDAGIVEKVLKRCFKVGHLAIRFFNWVKLRSGFHHTTETYNTMIYIAGEAKEFDLVKKLVNEMDDESCPKDIKTWTILISHYGKAKLMGELLLVLNKMRRSAIEPDETAYKSIVRVVCSMGNCELAMEFYKEMLVKNFGVDMKLYIELLNCLSASGDAGAVRLLGDDMTKIAGFQEEEVYSNMLRSFCKAGKVEEALGLVHEIRKKNIKSDPKIFEILVKGLSRAGRVNDAVEIVDIMKQSHVIDGKIYEIIINGCLRKEDSLKAFELFNWMKESGYLPSCCTYTEIIQQLFRSNEYEKACSLYKEMLENGLRPDIVLVTAMVAGHVRHNCISEAWRAFESMKKMGIVPTRKSYFVFLKELCKVSEPVEALKLLNEMLDFRISADGEVFRLVISSLEKKGELDKVVEVRNLYRTHKLYDQVTKLVDVPLNHQSLSERVYPLVDISKIPNHTLSQNVNPNQIQPVKPSACLLEPLTKVCGDHGRQEVCQIFSSLKDWNLIQEQLKKKEIQFEPDLVLEILHNCQRYGNTALQFFSWVGRRAGYVHTSDTYNMAIKISGSGKDFRHMRNLYLEMRRKGNLITADTWTIMITQYGRAGLTEMALKKFKEMKNDKCIPNGSTYKYLIIFLCERKGRKVDEAIKIFLEMIQAGYMPDKELVEAYLACLCEEGKVSDARKHAKLLCKSGFTTHLSYSLLIKALCRAGRLEEALALEDERGALGGSVDQYIYGSLVHGLLRKGRLNDALSKVEAMKQKGTLPTVYVYTSFIVHFSKEKQMGKALDIFMKMREDGCVPTVVTYSALIHGYMNEGMVSNAWNVFRHMKVKGPPPDFQTYTMFITCLCRIGRSEEALQLIYEMLECGILPSTVNFRTVFYGLNREGKQELAHTVLQTKWALTRQRKFSA